MSLPNFNLMLAALPELPSSSASGAGVAFDSVGRHSLGSATITLIIVVAIGVLCVIWAVFFRKSDRDPGRGALVEAAPRESDGRRRRRRKDKRRSRNPTRAEVGGLPPLGAGESSKPPL
jgi:hypothetical protein